VTPGRQARANLLYTIVTTQTGPWTIYDLAYELGVGVQTARIVVRDLRQLCGLLHDVTLTCEPNGHNQPWLYWLDGRPSDGEWWTANRVLDLNARVDTVRAVIEAEMRGIDHRTTEARAARVFMAALENVQRTLVALTP